LFFPNFSLDLASDELRNSLQHFSGSINLENVSAALNRFELRISGASPKGLIHHLKCVRTIFALEHQH
jgi:hypothetical protein